MRKKKSFSVLLVFFLLLTLFSPLKAGAVQEDCCATIITASDFQGGEDAFPNFGEMLGLIQEAGCTEPDLFLFGGDYGDDSGVDPTVSTELVMDQVRNVYPDVTRDNTIFVQGNHDAEDPSGEYLTLTGFYEFEDFVVYSINEDSYNAKQSGREDYAQVVQALSGDIGEKLGQMIETGDTRPVFVTTHVPLHHSSRRSYGDTLYSKYLFEVLNEMGQQLDIIFLFGHNHSGKYDDYIGGAVNYLPQGSSIRIPVPDPEAQGMDAYTEETLNFTYMNYGYVGYSNNTDNSVSTSTLTTGVIELCPTVIRISRYSKDGLYSTDTIDRRTPQASEPYVSLSGEPSGFAGESGFLWGTVSNFTDPVYSWSSSNPEVVTPLPAGGNAQLLYKSVGTAQISLTVTDFDGSTVSDSFTVTVSSSRSDLPEMSIYLDTAEVSGASLEYFGATMGDTLLLRGSFRGFSSDPSGLSVSWESSDPNVAVVENGLVTFVSDGTATLTFSVSNGATILREYVKLTISRYPRVTYVYRLTDTLEEGKSYILVSRNHTGSAYAMSCENVTSSDRPERLVAELGDLRQSGEDLTFITDLEMVQWQAVQGTDATGREGIFLQGADGSYLVCTSRGLATANSMTAGEGMLWSIHESGHPVSDSGYGPHYSSDGNFRREDEPEECYVYERIAVMSFAVWSSDLEAEFEQKADQAPDILSAPALSAPPEKTEAAFPFADFPVLSLFSWIWSLLT